MNDGTFQRHDSLQRIGYNEDILSDIEYIMNYVKSMMISYVDNVMNDIS